MKLYASFKKKTLHAIYVWAHKGPAKALGRHVLAGLGRRVLRVTAPADAAEQTVPLAPPARYRVKAPDHFGASGPVAEGVFPAVGAHVLNGMTISPYSPGILDEDRLIIPTHLMARRDRHLTDSNWMFEYDHAVAIGYDRPAQSVPSAVHVGCAGAFNWYHFMLECLPKAFLATRLDESFADYPLLMPDEARRYASYAEALEIAAGGRKCHFLEPGERVRSERTVAIDDVMYGPFNLRDGCWPKAGDYAFHPDIMLSFISHMREQLLGDRSEPSGGKRRIYLVRKEGVRRDHNQAELLKIAESFGFVAVAPETLSLREQARLFAEAEFVVGPSGAAWVGMMFGQSSLRGVSWLLKEYREFSAYSLLADLLDIRLEFLDATPKKPVKNSHEAFLASYRIDPREFANALARLEASSKTECPMGPA